MPLMYREATLHMEWCLECHRDPQKYVGPRELVFATASNASPHDQPADADWIKEYHVNSKLNCSVCHR
jgi:hypothetical protein